MAETRNAVSIVSTEYCDWPDEYDKINCKLSCGHYTGWFDMYLDSEPTNCLVCGAKIMNNYYYCVETYDGDDLVLREGYIKAESKEQAKLYLVEDGVVYYRYKFLDLHVVKEQ